MMNRSAREIGVKRHPKISHKTQVGGFMFNDAVKQIMGWQLALARLVGRLDQSPGCAKQAHHVPTPLLALISLINGLQFT
jgi:hypothetical protein